MPESGSQERADTLVKAVAKKHGHPGVGLDSANDRAFGSFGLHFNSALQTLTLRVYITTPYLGPRMDEEGRRTFQRVLVALDDPQIGGKYDHGGGKFFFDKGKGIIFLIKDFPIDELTPDRLNTEIESQLLVADFWVREWYIKVVKEVQDAESPVP